MFKKNRNIILIMAFAFMVFTFVDIMNVSADVVPTTAASKAFNPDYVSGVTGLSDGSGSSPILTILISIIKFVVGIVGGLAVLMILVGGIMYITSSGDQGKVETAKNIIVYAIVGLVVSLLAWIIVDVVISNIG